MYFRILSTISPLLCATEKPTAVVTSMSILCVSAQLNIMAEEMGVIEKRQKMRIMEFMILYIMGISYIILSPICFIFTLKKKRYLYLSFITYTTYMYILKNIGLIILVENFFFTNVLTPFSSSSKSEDDFKMKKE